MGVQKLPEPCARPCSPASLESLHYGPHPLKSLRAFTAGHRLFSFSSRVQVHFNKPLLGIFFVPGTVLGAGHGEFLKDLPNKMAAV